MSHAGGAAQVIALDINPERLDMAAHFGASLCLYAGDDVPARLAQHTGVPNPVHVVIEVSGQASAMAQTLDLLAIGGIAVWQGAVFPQQTQLNAEKIIRNLLTIKGLHNYNLEDFRAAVRFMTHHHQAYPFERLIHTGFSLEQAEAAFAYAVQANPFRVGIQTD
jgi:alcohol dehydrogenase